MKKIWILMWLGMWGSLVQAECYLNIEKAGNMNPQPLSELGISLISQFVEPLEATPMYGLGTGSCMYKLGINENANSMIITITGEKLNASGNSNLGNMEGAQQAILRAIYRGKPDKQVEICSAYKSILSDECGNQQRPTPGNNASIHRDKSVLILYDPRADAGTLPLKFSDPNEREVILAAIVEFNRIFLEHQFNVFDQNRLEEVNREIAKHSDYANFDERALELAQSNSSDLLITFRLINYVDKGKDGLLSWAKAELTGKIVFAGTGQLIGVSREKGESAFGLGATGGVVFSNMAKAATKAANPAAQELIRMFSETAPPKDMFRLIFSGLSILQKRSLPIQLKMVPGYKGHRILAQTKNRLDIELDMELGDHNELSKVISETIEKDSNFQGYLLDAECTRNRCSFQSVKK
ncbi:MAG: hypothetical protein HQM12_03095 [SAR324 cluster bacterium]|nr:hypothetical protein [SAR324 cluster bacterium]